MSRIPPGPHRYFDGRVREVASVRWMDSARDRKRKIRIETLTCGHVLVPNFNGGGNSHGGGGAGGAGRQWRICWECEGWQDKEKQQ